MTTPTGTEARVCALIAQRQSMGLRKYGTTVEHNPLELRAWLQHGLEEALDLSVYLMRSIEQIDADEAVYQGDPLVFPPITGCGGELQG